MQTRKAEQIRTELKAVWDFIKAFPAMVVRHISKDRAVLFLAVIVVGVAHVAEHWLFKFDSAFADVPDVFLTFQQNFGDPNLAFLVLMFTVVLVWVFTMYCMFRGGRAASIPLFLFGLLLVASFYHIVREWEGGFYYPGAVTGVIMVGIGILMLREGHLTLRGN